MGDDIVFLSLGGGVEMTVIGIAPEPVNRDGIGCLGIVGIETYSFIVPGGIGIMGDDIVFLRLGIGVEMMVVFATPETVDGGGSYGWRSYGKTYLVICRIGVIGAVLTTDIVGV